MQRLSPAAVDDGAAEHTGRTTILLVDDEPGFHETMGRYLADFRLLSAYSGAQARRQLAKHHVDVVLLDLNLPDTTGLKLLMEWREERDDFEVVVITSHAELARAVECVKAGAFDFLAKSHETYQRVRDHVRRALEHRQQRRAFMESRSDSAIRDGLAQIERSKSAEMQQLVQQLRLVSPTPLTVLLEGESGVGKELLARWLHQMSTRAARPYVAVNMAAIPPHLLESTLFGHEKGSFTGADRQRLGKFELADGGTLFLDEIGEFDQAFQAKLLRALQEREIERIGGAEPVPVDLRIVAATNRDLEADVIAGRFRADLWFRLNVMRVRVPPLRERTEDIPDLIDTLARRHGAVMNRPPPVFAEDATRALAAYSWPGNVRELENLVMRMVALNPGNTLHMEDIPPEYCLERLGQLALWSVEHAGRADQSLYDMATAHFERYLVRHMIERCHGNKSEAARLLGISYSTLKQKLGSTRGSSE